VHRARTVWQLPYQYSRQVNASIQHPGGCCPNSFAISVQIVHRNNDCAIAARLCQLPHQHRHQQPRQHQRPIRREHAARSMERMLHKTRVAPRARGAHQRRRNCAKICASQAIAPFGHGMTILTVLFGRTSVWCGRWQMRRHTEESIQKIGRLKLVRHLANVRDQRRPRHQRRWLQRIARRSPRVTLLPAAIAIVVRDSTHTTRGFIRRRMHVLHSAHPILSASRLACGTARLLERVLCMTTHAKTHVPRRQMQLTAT